MKRLVRKIIGVAPILIFFVCSAVTVSAEEYAQDDGWKFSLELYFWGASIGGKSASGSDVDVEIDDILDSLELAFMGLGELRKGKWSLATDLIYLNLEDGAAIAPGLNANLELSGWVVTPFIGYNLMDTERLNLDILGGVRYLNLKAELTVGPLQAEDSGSNWDGVIGVRGGLNLTKRWYLPFHLDIGTGNSKVTWQAFGGVAYRFKRVHLALAYRYLRWNFDDDKTFDNIYFHGPFAGVKFLF
jgi:hypothetical protein